MNAATIRTSGRLSCRGFHLQLVARRSPEISSTELEGNGHVRLSIIRLWLFPLQQGPRPVNEGGQAGMGRRLFTYMPTLGEQVKAPRKGNKHASAANQGA